MLGTTDKTFEVSGHHYALVAVTGLPRGEVIEYDVRLDGELVWPPVHSSGLPQTPGVSDSPHPAPGVLPASQIRTLDPDRPQRIAYGSCRVATQRTVEGQRKYGVDALEAYAVRVAHDPGDGRPDLMVMLGDQVYADETTEITQRRIAGHRDISKPPHGEVADFEEYTWLYHESWSDPQIRWLMSTVPIAMIFDDHDVHDDWNTSRSWRADVKKTGWWAERIVGGLVSYWVYQHIGNLSPDELADDEVYQRVRALAAAGQDCAPMLREFAVMADAEADGGKGYRWSFWRDLGRTRLVVIDSRCGRMLDGDHRSMLSEDEFAWVEEHTRGDYDHLLIGTSLPWLMAPALHQIEAWSEHLAEGTGRRAVLGEKLRRAADLEHWPAFRESFDRLARLIADVASGPQAPATVCVLSGDVHHSYICEADVTALMSSVPERASKVYQLTCSPVHNTIPWVMRLAFSISWTSPVTRLARLLFTRPRTIPETVMSWGSIGGPIFGNAISTLVLEGRAARVMLESTRDAQPLPPRNRLSIPSGGHEPENQWALTEQDWDPARYPLKIAVARDLSGR
ncbi:alkaline phosphatase D family protein [Kineosporia mesophila]|uniref:Alkaline phosphatase D family protein n=1 Tax=Kineosporia mesophila TaxID=566012 RepID=A0ABP7ASK8_9ACTN|nr:alkaline phosphatase family protein [Kineosporia mesophila]